MFRDVFYYGDKPNVHPSEQFAENLADARSKATTPDFWIINESCDYRNFDWDFDFESLPDEDVWAADHNNVWPSQHQKDSGTWLCPKEHSDIVIYRGDVDPVQRKNERTSSWVLLENIDESKFDFSWHPDPTSPPYIYKWGCKFFPPELKHVLEYHVEGATNDRYMRTIAELLPHTDCWVEHDLIDKTSIDMSWRPSPLDPPFIYVWGNKHVDGKLKPTLEYHTPGATDKKYMPELVEVLPEWDKWVEVQAVDKNNFDFSWRPDPTAPPYIYAWGNKWINAEERPTLQYHCENATQIKYMSNDVPVMPEKDRWKVLRAIDLNSFDFSWRPDPKEPNLIYVFGNELYDAAKMPTISYTMPNSDTIKYVNDLKAKLASDPTDYEHLEDAYLSDYSWVPDPTAPPYIYAWGNQWNKPEDKISIQYVVPGATAYKYMEERATRKPVIDNWVISDDIDTDRFDFSWEPNPNEPPYIYAWGNQWNKPEDKISVQYVVPKATSYKYMEERAIRNPNKENFRTLFDNVVEFDYSWEPNPHSPPYTYVFGNQWYAAEVESTVEYRGLEGVATKYINDIVATLGNTTTNWTVPKNVDASAFDFSWHPEPGSPPYIYEFATVWNNRGGPIYTVPGATEYKYVEDVKAKLLPDKTHWKIPTGIDSTRFDFSWVPHPAAPPYIYQFATKLDDIWIDDGPRYLTPGHGKLIGRLENSIIYKGEIEYPKYVIETTLEDLVKQHPTEQFWALNKNINYDNFDFTWKPDKENLFNVTVFGSDESETTHTYFVNATYYLDGHTDFNYIQSETGLDSQYLANIFAKPDMFFVDKSNPESAARFEVLREKFGTRIQKTRYLNSWVDTVNRCANRAGTEILWVLSSELDYSNFNFEYYPNPWQMKMVHVFGTQWSHWGTTFMVNRETFREDTKYINIIEHLSNLNFVKDRRARATTCVNDIVMIDHGNTELAKISVQVEQKAERKLLATIPYHESYLNTLKKFIKKLPEKKEHYLWICSSVCDYSQFDFTYICDPFSKDNLHVFPSGTQKFGDTFFIDVNKTKEIIDDMEKLEEYHKVNFNSAVKTSRLPEPLIVSRDDMHVNALDKITGFPYATIIAADNVFIETPPDEPMNLWSPETKNIIITSTGATRIIVPSEAKDIVKNELYDYPYIKRLPKLTKSAPLDIVFVSNGETVADQNYEHLVKFTNGLPNKIHRVDGINGRTEALHAAADSSETPWFFCIPAKLFINKKFDWNYQADRMQTPKHYIFNALYPVNDLFYGHQSMVLYNKNLVLGNEGVGLDFTLDSPHMSVELNSGTVLGDTDEHSTWRTAFREAVKLKRYADAGDDVASTRLGVWTSVGKGNYGEWSIKGAEDGIEFYNEVNGDLTQLRQSYYWDWLRTRYDSKY